MTETAQKFCGCKYVQAGGDGKWWQVIACPSHPMTMQPLDEVPGD